MVTTSSLGTDLNFKLNTLNPSEFEEDQTVLDAVRLVIDNLITALKPVIKYVDRSIEKPSQGGVRGVFVTKDSSGWHVVLTREGEFTEVLLTSGGEVQEMGSRSSAEIRADYVVSDIIEGLREVFAKATKKREEHLAAVEARKTMLDQMVAVMNKVDGQAETQS